MAHKQQRMTVPATKPSFSEADIAFITKRFTDILRGKSYLSMGKYGEEFERRFARYIGTKHAVACNSGTAALELIFRAIGVEGKDVVVPSNTFAATAYAVMAAGGHVVFADCGEDMCLTRETVEAAITPNTVAVAHVHIGGLISPEIASIAQLCRKRHIHLVEDAAQAHGAKLGGVFAGAFGTAGAFSFFSTKVMTTGEGGVVTTNDAELVRRMKSLREFGKERRGVYINYHTTVGSNWRMPEVAALLGLRQLSALPRFLRQRRRVADLYTRLLARRDDIVLVTPVRKDASNYFKFTILLPHHDRMAVHAALVERGVSPSGYVYEIPLHQQPVFPQWNARKFPTTERLCAQHLCLPIFPTMKNAEVRYVAEQLLNVLDQKI